MVGAVPAGFRARRRFRGPFPSLPRAVCRLHETIARTMDGHLVARMRRRLKRGRSVAEAEGSEAEAAQAGAATQGRGAGEGAKPAGTATDDEPSADRWQTCAMSAPSATPRAIPPPGIGYKLHVDTADERDPGPRRPPCRDSPSCRCYGDAAYDSIGSGRTASCWPQADHEPPPLGRICKRLEAGEEGAARSSLLSRVATVRSGSERINGRLKDEFGGRHVRVAVRFWPTSCLA